MPRMNLTDAEAAIINKKREDERFYKAGWQSAIDTALEIVTEATDNEMTMNQVIEHIHTELRKVRNA